MASLGPVVSFSTTSKSGERGVGGGEGLEAGPVRMLGGRRAALVLPE